MIRFLILLITITFPFTTHATDQKFWEKLPHPNGSYGYDELLPDLLNIKGLPYHEARQTIIAAGWAPLQTLREGTEDHEIDAMSGTGKTVWNIGYHELQSCSGGVTYCAFLFQNNNGDQFRVVTKGEQWENPSSSALVFGYRFNP